MRYEAWIETTKGVRIEEVEASGIRAAHTAAVGLCREGEFVRGVNPLPPEPSGEYDPATGELQMYDEVAVMRER